MKTKVETLKGEEVFSKRNDINKQKINALQTCLD